MDKKLIQIAKKYDGSVYLVGGAVRDELLGIDSKDLDYLFTNIPLTTLKDELQTEFPTAHVNEVGESFGDVRGGYAGPLVVACRGKKDPLSYRCAFLG